jgi:hypothetical protein
VHQRSISTNTEVAVLRIKKITRLIPKALVMRHLLRGTTINMLDNVKNKETVETRSVGEIDTRYSSLDIRFMYNPATPTPRRMSSIRTSRMGDLLNIGPPKQADIAIMGYPILATVTSATKSDNELPCC